LTYVKIVTMCIKHQINR